MSRFLPKMIVLDLDLTLLDSDGRIPASSRLTLETLHRKGIHVVFASARRWTKIKSVISDLPITTPVVASNGTVIIDPVNNVPLSVKYLSREAALEAICFAREEGICAFYYSDPAADGHIYRESEPEELSGYGEKFLNADPQLMVKLDDLTFIDHQPIKILMLSNDTEDRAKRLERRLLDRIGSGERVFWYRQDPILEVIPTDCNKATAVQELAEMLGIVRDEVIAFGDDRIDIEILRWAGVGVAMDHGSIAVRRAADKVIEWDNGEEVNRELSLLI